MLSILHDREERHKDSPFVPFAEKEGFGLWAVHNSYIILTAMIHDSENYFFMAEKLAREHPEHAEILYRILRKGMYEEAKNHTSILYAITNICDNTTVNRKHNSLPGSPYSFLIEVSSDESSSE